MPGCSRRARGHAKARRCFCALFKERSARCGDLKRGRVASVANALKTAAAWPQPGFGWRWPLPPPRPAAGLGGFRGIFRQHDAPKQLSRYALERRCMQRETTKSNGICVCVCECCCRTRTDGRKEGKVVVYQGKRFGVSNLDHAARQGRHEILPCDGPPIPLQRRKRHGTGASL